MEFIEKFNRLMDIVIEPVFFSILGIGCILIGYMTTIPTTNELSQRHGYLKSYFFKEECYRYSKCDYTPIITLQDGSRFWTDAFSGDKNTAELSLNKTGLYLTFYIDPHSGAKPIDNAIKGYGLWIDGKQIQSAEEQIGDDSFAVKLCFPLFGIFFCIMAVYLIYRNKNKYA